MFNFKVIIFLVKVFCVARVDIESLMAVRSTGIIPFLVMNILIIGLEINIK